jgi:hypothetical protein
MKTKYVLTLSMTMLLMICGTMAWSQGRGHDNGRRGKAQQNGHNNKHHDHDRKHRVDYSYHDRDRHHNHQPQVVHVYHRRPVVERTVVVHHHHERRAERPRYVYYRDYDVYYDCDRKVYITFGGRNWSVSTEVPIRMYYVDRNTVASVNVDYYNDDFTHYLDTRRPGGRVCDHW